MASCSGQVLQVGQGSCIRYFLLFDVCGCVGFLGSDTSSCVALFSWSLSIYLSYKASLCTLRVSQVIVCDV